jgi:hypothetical protein
VPADSSSLVSLSGYVFIDSNGNGVIAAGDWGVGNAVVTLLEPSNPSFSMSYTTGAGGSYQFGNLQPGVYSVETPLLSQIFQSGRSEIGGFVDSSGDTTLSGSDYGTAATCDGMCMVSDITVPEGYGAVDYNFAEGNLLSDQVSKRLFLTSSLTTSTSTFTTITPTYTYWLNGSQPTVPEPGTLALLGAGGIAAGLMVWRRKAARR